MIPSLFREQRKLWPGTSGSNGLQTRRSKEAELFQEGLDEMERNWPPEGYAEEDELYGTSPRYRRNDVVGPNHPIWTSGELHPAVAARKDRILGTGREGENYRKVRAGVLYAVSAAFDQANALGYHGYVTSGNRWVVSYV